MNIKILIINFILTLKCKYPYTYLRILRAKKNNFQWMIDLINKYTPLLNNEYNLQTKIYWIINNLNSFPKCKICKKEIRKNIRNIDDPRYTYCSKQCSLTDKDKIMHRKENCKKKYGNENYNNSKKISITRLNFSIEKKKKIYNKFLTTLLNTDKKVLYNRLLKRKLSLRKSYNVDYPMQSIIILERIKNTNNKKYGVDWPVQNNEIYKKGQNRYTYLNINFDSSWELAYYIWLKDNNISFEYQPNILFEYFDKNNVKHIYHPDFLLSDTNEIIEIKGQRFFTKNLPIKDGKEPWYEKYNCMLEHNVKILKYNDMKFYLNYIKSKYSKDYLLKFRNR